MGQSYQPNFDKMIKGQSAELSDTEIMSEIRKVMVADSVVHPETVKPQALVREQAVEQEQAQECIAEPAITAEPQKPSFAKTAVHKIAGYKPRWSHNLMILSLAIFLYSPVGVIAVVALAIAALVLSYWVVGAVRMGTVGRACFGLYHRVLPAQADRVLDSANRTSDRMQALSNRLPSRLSQGLYLPSFSGDRTSDLDLVEPFDRLLSQRQGGQQTTAD